MVFMREITQLTSNTFPNMELLFLIMSPLRLRINLFLGRYDLEWGGGGLDVSVARCRQWDGNWLVTSRAHRAAEGGERACNVHRRQNAECY